MSPANPTRLRFSKSQQTTRTNLVSHGVSQLPREPPFISKTLKLVSIAILIATISIAVTAAYSGYEEYGALTSTVTGSSLNQLRLAINGSTLSISGLNVPNKMTFPLTLELSEQ